MAMKSYNESYLPYVAENLGAMFEYASDNKLEPINFWSKFVNSNIAKQIEKGNPKYLTCSAQDYIREIYNNGKVLKDVNHIDKDKYYWAGWALAHLQYHTAYSFYKINNYLSIQEVLRLYSTLHEADITKFYDVAKDYFKNANKQTNLQKMRKAMNLSQSELAQKAEVSLRSIQMYEQRRNDINKAQADVLYRLSRVLGCEIEDLME